MSGPIYENELVRERSTPVREGDVIRRDGRPVHMSKIIQRCWGFPGKPAREAWRILEHEMGEDFVWLAGHERAQQQTRLLRRFPELVGILLHSLATRTTREQGAHRFVKWLTVEFDAVITDEGLESGILAAVAHRLGLSVDELRKRADFGPWEEDDGRDILFRVSDLGESV